jgi:hypothetical protein
MMFEFTRRAPLARTFLFLSLTATLALPAFSAAPNIWPGKASTTIVAGTSWSYYPWASDADGDSLTWSATNVPTFLRFSSSDGSLKGTPTSANVGTYGNIVLSVTDGKTKVSLAAITITVTGTGGGTTPPPPTGGTGNNPPVISGTPGSSVPIGVQYNFTPTASDPEGKTLTFSITNKPSWATFGTTSGRLHGTPASSYTGVYSNIIVSVSDGVNKASLAPFAITVGTPSGGSGNSAPVISGAPATSATVGVAYGFQPTASDANKDALTFSINTKPSWATFSASTGRLSGTPSVIGSTSGIVISVSDGKTSAALPAFGITVNAAGGGTPTTGAATLNWTPPTRNSDGSTLTNLAGYRISYGKSATSLTNTVQIANPGIASYVVDNLASGVWYFALKSYTSGGSESTLSNPVSTTIP